MLTIPGAGDPRGWRSPGLARRSSGDKPGAAMGTAAGGTPAGTMDDEMNTSPPIRIAGLDHVVLRCARFDETMAFYVNVLGCVPERELPDLGLHQLRAGRALIDLVPVGSKLGGDEPPDPGHGNMAHFCLRLDTPDWEVVAAHLRGHGIAFEPPETRYGADGYGPSVYVTDPEGNTVELKA